MTGAQRGLTLIELLVALALALIALFAAIYKSIGVTKHFCSGTITGIGNENRGSE